jgi:hypothetical protein
MWIIPNPPSAADRYTSTSDGFEGWMIYDMGWDDVGADLPLRLHSKLVQDRCVRIAWLAL